MSSARAPVAPTSANFDAALRVAKQVLAHEAQVLASLQDNLGPDFAQVLHGLWACQGQVVVTGVGKSGHIGRKAAATFASVGCRATFMHPTEAVHGDLGQLGPGDVVLALSFSGATPELLQLVGPLQQAGVPLLALVGAPRSALALAAGSCCAIGPIQEACPLNLVPTASTTAMLAVADAWAMALFSLKGQRAQDYARRHPAGALGQAAKQVGQVMRAGAHNPVAGENEPLHGVLKVMSCTPGRPGAASIVDGAGRLVGLFTDGDLRRCLLDGPVDTRVAIAALMHPNPKTVRVTDLVQTAAALLQRHAIDQLPVVDDERRPVGLLDIHDVLPAS